MKKNQHHTAESAAPIRMINPGTQHIRQVSHGYNWYAAILGPFYFLSKRMYRIAILCLILPIVAQVFFAERANKLYMLQLVKQGYRAIRDKPGVISTAEWQWGMVIPRYRGSHTTEAEAQAQLSRLE